VPCLREQKAKPAPFEDGDMTKRAGEDDEEILFSRRCKLSHLVAEDDAQPDKKTWKPLGIGEVRVNKYIAGDNMGKCRLLVREESATQKLLVNTFLNAQMEVRLVWSCFARFVTNFYCDSPPTPDTVLHMHMAAAEEPRGQAGAAGHCDCG
jgi:hypothetical protein